MSQGRKKSAKRGVGHSNDLSPSAMLRALRQHMKTLTSEKLDEMDRAEELQRSSPHLGISNHWAMQCRSLLASVSSPWSFIDSSSALTFTTQGLVASGKLHGTCADGADQWNVAVDIGSTLKSAFLCNCPNLTDRKYICAHSYGFLKHVIRELGDVQSVLNKRLQEGRFDKSFPDETAFAPDVGKILVRRLDLLLKGIGSGTVTTNDDELPPVVEMEPRRIAWNISLSPQTLTLQPMSQMAKKKGNGWMKPRYLTLPEFFQAPNEMFSIKDHKIRDSLRAYMNTYDIFSTRMGEVLVALIGAPNVHLNGEPATIESGELNCELRKSGNLYSFHLVTEPNYVSWTHAFKTNFLFSIAPELNRIKVCQSSDKALTLVRELMRVPSCPESALGDILPRVQQIKQLVPLKVDGESPTTEVPEPISPAMLLRSRKDGALDFGFRVRLSDGRLQKPGSGTLVRTELKEGVPVHYKRSISTETELAERCLVRLGLDSREWEGTIANFDEALAFLERLQTQGNPQAENGNVRVHPEEAIETLWEKSSEAPIRVLGTVSPSNVRVGIARKRDWFNISGECKFDNSSIDLHELLESLQLTSEEDVRGEYVRVGESGWAKISMDLRKGLSRLRDSVNSERGALKCDITSAMAMRDLGGMIQVESGRDWQDCLKQLEHAENLEPVVPQTLNAQLRDYQTEGFCWMRRLAEWGVGGVLADDMGLGKTVQTLAVLLDRKEVGPAIVIAPTSVGFNWGREAKKFAPDLQTHLYRDTDRNEFLTTLGPGDLVVCSYGLAMRDVKRLAKVKWSTMVLDEAQAIKNSRSKTSQAIATIPAKWRIALTGTPVENHLGELWSLFHVVSPGVFGGWEQFRRRFATPIEKENDAERRDALRLRLQPFVLRRTKSEVLKDLPPRTETNVFVELSPAERAVYEQVRKTAIGEIDTIAGLTDVKDQRFRVLALLTRLRQLSCHPKLVVPSWTERSAKLNQLLDTLTQLKEEGHRVLIFSQFVQHLALIREMLDAENISYQYLDGSTPPGERQVQVDKFQNGDATAFLISLKAGGTGLNLTAADYVIHMDPWWNPAVEDQATDRAHRIGQDKPVMVYRMIAEKTIEEEILKLHDTKRDLIAGVLEGAHAAATLSTSDLIALLRE